MSSLLILSKLTSSATLLLILSELKCLRLLFIVSYITVVFKNISETIKKFISNVKLIFILVTCLKGEDGSC